MLKALPGQSCGTGPSLGLLRIPDLLRNRATHLVVHFDVGELQLLVDLIQVLSVKNHKQVPLREQTLFEVAIELFVSGSEWTLWPLLIFETLNPLDLLLALAILPLLEPLSTLFSQNIVVRRLYFVLHRHGY